MVTPTISSEFLPEAFFHHLASSPTDDTDGEVTGVKKVRRASSLAALLLISEHRDVCEQAADSGGLTTSTSPPPASMLDVTV